MKPRKKWHRILRKVVSYQGTVAGQSERQPAVTGSVETLKPSRLPLRTRVPSKCLAVTRCGRPGSIEQVKRNWPPLNADIEKCEGQYCHDRASRPIRRYHRIATGQLEAYASNYGHCQTGLKSPVKRWNLRRNVMPDRFKRYQLRPLKLGRLETFNSQVYATESRINEEHIP